MNKKKVLENISPIGIMKWMNEFFIKDSGNPFNNQDIQGYVNRCLIPTKFGGGYSIIKKAHKYNDNLYDIVNLNDSEFWEKNQEAESSDNTEEYHNKKIEDIEIKVKELEEDLSILREKYRKLLAQNLKLKNKS